MSKIPESDGSGHNVIAAVPPASSGWPCVDRRRNDRRKSDRRSDNRVSQHAAVRLCTAREQQVLTLLLQGMTNKQIAQLLGIAEDTVKKHLVRAYRKVGIHRRTLFMAGAAAPASATGTTPSVD